LIYFVSDMKGGYGGSDIYSCFLKDDGSWTEPKNVGGVINSPHNEDGPFLYDDSTLYFSSRGHNSIGGYDIFVAKLRKDGSWTTPVNLGFPLNSAGDDLYLILAESGDAYYASDRQGGLGGLDIYHAKFNLKVDDLLANIKPVFVWGYIIDELTSEGVNADVTITNSAESETIFDGPTDEMGQFTASLPSMKKYELKIVPVDCDPTQAKKYPQTGTAYTPGYEPSQDDPVPPTSITGLITDEDGVPMQCPIEIIDIRDSKLAAKVIPDTNGAFSLTLPSASTYRFDVITAGCAHQAVVVQQVDNFTDNLVNGINVRLENIYFDFDKSYIRPDAIEIMNRHAELFIRYKDWKIKVIGHTDNMGSESYNQFLSQKRAKSVVDYLVARGAKRSHFKYEGMGFSQPVASNATEEGRQLNRRCEFRIVKW
jgi:outer membrane protein OmpA-like peptidoglycan-associated protein